MQTSFYFANSGLSFYNSERNNLYSILPFSDFVILKDFYVKSINKVHQGKEIKRNSFFTESDVWKGERFGQRFLTNLANQIFQRSLGTPVGRGSCQKSAEYEPRQRLCPPRTTGGVQVGRESVLNLELLQEIPQSKLQPAFVRAIAFAAWHFKFLREG